MTEAPPPGTSLACRDVVELLSDYLEDALDPDSRTELEAHLALCSGCAAYLEQLRETIRELGQLRVQGLGERAWAELRAAFREVHRRPAGPGAGQPQDS